MSTWLCTNGELVDEAMAQRIADSGIAGVSVGLMVPRRVLMMGCAGRPELLTRRCEPFDICATPRSKWSWISP